jgi:H+/Cl- antiporter ClcA
MLTFTRKAWLRVYILLCILTALATAALGYFTHYVFYSSELPQLLWTDSQSGVLRWVIILTITVSGLLIIVCWLIGTYSFRKHYPHATE